MAIRNQCVDVYSHIKKLNVSLTIEITKFLLNKLVEEHHVVLLLDIKVSHLHMA